MEVKDVRAHLLMYDIPTNSKLANPSNELWRWGARINLSCWVVPDKNVPLLPIGAWREKGARVELVRFDERDGATILRLAREALARELETKRQSLDDAVARLREKYEEVAAGDEKGIQQAHAFGYRYLYAAKRLLAHAQECAIAFDLLGDVRELCDGLRDTIKAKDSLFFAMWDAKVKSRSLPNMEMFPDMAAEGGQS